LHKALVPIAALAVGISLSLSGVAHADDGPAVDLTPGPHIIADPNSPTGYTGHFVYYNPTATSVRFDADILLRNWQDLSDPTVYQPQQYRPGLMRGGGAYDTQMTNAGNGYWYTDVPLTAGPNQYWFYVNNNTNLWITDPVNSPIYAPDGLTGNARRAFNKVYVPYDAAKQNFAPLADRVIGNLRPDEPHGTWSYVPFQINGATRTLGVYLPPGYDPNRAQPYKTIYLQHGSQQDQSDWLNMGDVPVIMDNLIADGQTEPAVIVTTNSAYMGASPYTNSLEGVIIPFIQSHYNVSADRMDRAFAGLSMGGSMTINIINNNPLRFGYYGVFSWAPPFRTTTPNLKQAYIYMGCGAWDALNLCVTQAQLNALNGFANYKFDKIAGGHDFNTWPQLFANFARDYVWQRGAFVNSAPVFAAGGESQSVDEGQALSFGVSATDPDGDAVTYSASGLPAGASFDAATQQLSWTPDFTQSGTYTVTFTASDGTKSYSLSSSKVVTITVNDVPPPVAQTPPSISGTAAVNSVLSADAGQWDVADSTFAYQWSANGQAIAGATGTTLLVTPDLSGASVAVTVTASAAGHPDGTATSQPVTIKTVPAWSSSAVYNTDDLVIDHGKVYQALWWTQNQAPGDPNGPWQEMAVTSDGSTAWTASRIFNTGDQVYYQGNLYQALWWTRNQAPGNPNGPWSQVVTTPAGAPDWTATTIYNSGDKVTYQGHVYQAQYWTRNQTPGARNGPWKPLS
jgi:chitodextrinase